MPKLRKPRLFGGKNKSRNTDVEDTPSKPVQVDADHVTSPSSVGTAATAVNTPESIAKNNATTSSSTTTKGKKELMGVDDENDNDNDNSQDDDDNDNASDAGSSGSEEPWDVKRSLSEDANSTGGSSSNTGPSPTMKRKIQQRLHQWKDTDEVDQAGTNDKDKDKDKDKDQDPATAAAAAAATISAAASSSSDTKRMLSMGRRSVRPLSPPAQAGMKKFDNNNTEEEDDAGPHNRDDPDDDLPMDELEAYQKEQSALNMMCGVTDHVNVNDEDGAGAGAGGALGGGDTLCDYTLTALGDMCGVAEEPTTTPPQSQSQSQSQRRRNSSKSPPTTTYSSNKAVARALMMGSNTQKTLKPPYGVEEQTAIEVEYIEPERRQDNTAGSAGAGPRKKNLLVQAMARRAKEDYETKKGKPARVSSPQDTVAVDHSTMESHPRVEADAEPRGQRTSSSPPPDNVYSSFTSSEKRKFLTLINNGLTPSDATAQVLNDRREAEEAGDDGSASKSSGGKGLRFWSRGGKSMMNDNNPAVPTEVQRRSRPPTNDVNKTIEDDATEEEEEEGFARSGISYYDAVRKVDNEDLPLDDDDDEGLTTDSPASAAANKSKQVKRQSRLAKFGFARLGKQVGDEEDQQQQQQQQTLASTANVPRRDPPSTLPPKSPKPNSTARSAGVPTDREVLDDLEAAAEASRSVFKPIPSPASPTEDKGADPDGTVAAHEEEEPPGIQPSFSGDSLLDDDDDDDDDEVDKLNNRPEDEQDIVVPAAPEDQYVEEEKEEITPPQTQSRSIGQDDEEQDLTSQRLGVSAEKMLHSPPRAMTVDLDVESAYMNSTEIMSHLNNGTSIAGDQPSVRTHATYATTGTNYTTSTRSRRPGAARQRLTSQKTGETAATAHKYMGWQESIQAAAAGIGKVWDPVKGWVDYKTVEDEKKSDDSIVVPVPGMPPSYPKVTRTGASVASVATFEEQAPPREGAVLQEQASAMSVSRAPQSPHRHGAAARKDAAKSPARSRGWVETMKEATARIGTQDKRWDPERGWIGPDGEELVIAPSGDRYQGGMEGQVESDTQDFGTILPVALQSTTSPQEPQEQQRAMSSSVQPREAHAPSGQDTAKVVGRQAPGVQNQQQVDDHHSTDGISLRSGEVSTQSGRYIQLGETGSVASYHFGKPSSRAAPKEAGAKLSSTPEGAPQTGNGLLVNVRKEKVSPADASMFPEIPKGSNKGSRRSSGPVDLDEVDEMETGSFVAATDFSWDDDNFDGSSPGKSRNKAYSSGKSEVSQGSASTSSKTIPKLRAPKRDTSPIRGGRGASKQSPPSEAQSSAPHNDSRPSPPASQMPQQKSRAAIITPDVHGRPQASPPGSGPDRSLNPASPGPGNDARSTHTADSSPSVSSVKNLHDYWERRSSTKEGLTPSSAEWKTFLSKKVRDENTAIEGVKGRVDDEKDSLFDFGSEGIYSNARRSQVLGSVPRNEDAGLRSLEEISNLSPIQNVHDDDDEDDDEAPSEVSTGVAQGTTFLERLQACAAPMMPKSMGEGGQGANCNPMPMAHLNFLRNNPSATGSPQEQGGRPSSKFVPPNLCGKPDIISEEDEDASGVDMDTEALRKDESRSSKSNPRSSRQGGDMSSVISDEQFGQKTAYLEALAMKAAVSGSKKNRKSRSSGPETGADSEKHSESWQRFLDRKATSRSEDQEDVSRAADKYAEAKVDRMMENMAARSRSGEFQPRPVEEATGAFPSVGNASKFKGADQFQFKNESAKAAEDLAAARVEAMMHALSSPQTLDEDEGEI
jgi:hypothetical protein